MLGLTDPLRLGESPWFVRVRCTPDAAESIGRALARRTDTTWVNLISGGTEISCSVRTPEPSRGDTLLLQPRTHLDLPPPSSRPRPRAAPNSAPRHSHRDSLGPSLHDPKRFAGTRAGGKTGTAQVAAPWRWEAAAAASA